MRVPATSTSIIGSRKNAPREPLRTIRNSILRFIAFVGNRSSGSIRAERHGRRVARNVNRRAHDAAIFWLTNASNDCGVTFACNSSLSTSTDGPQPQLPRQKTGSSEIAPSAVVSWKSMPSDCFACASSARAPRA